MKVYSAVLQHPYDLPFCLGVYTTQVKLAESLRAFAATRDHILVVEAGQYYLTMEGFAERDAVSVLEHDLDGEAGEGVEVAVC